MAAVSAVALTAVVTRAFSFARFPPTWDESLLGIQAYTGLVDVDHRWDPLFNAYGPLCNWLAIGLNWLGASPLHAVRLISAAAAVASVALVFSLGRRLGGSVVGLSAAGLYAIAPVFVVHDTMGVVEPLLTSLVAATLLCSLRLAERPDLGRTVALGVVMGLIMLTKLNGAFALLAAPMVLLVASDRRRVLLALLAAELLALALWQVQRISPVYGEAQEFASWAEGVLFRPPSEVVRDAPRYLVDAIAQTTRVLGSWLTPAVVLATLVGVAALIRTNRRLAAVYVVFSGLGVLSVAALTPVLWARYALVSFVPLVVLAGYGMVVAGSHLYRRPHGVGLLAAVVIACLLPNAVFAARWAWEPAKTEVPVDRDDDVYRTGATSGVGWNEIAERLRGEMQGRPTTRLTYYTGTPWHAGILLDDPRWDEKQAGGFFRETFTARDGRRLLVVSATDDPLDSGCHLYLWDRAAGPPPRGVVRGMTLVTSVRRTRAAPLELYRCARPPARRL